MIDKAHSIVLLRPCGSCETGVQHHPECAQLSEVVYVEMLDFGAHLKHNKQK